jgi:hypothetical protein
MAISAERVQRAAPARARSHASARPVPRMEPLMRDGKRAMVKATAGVQLPEQPVLFVVPRRRRTAGVVTLVAFVLSSLMLGAAAFQTQLARQQLEIDRLDRGMRDATEQYNVLRRERSELRSPGRLAEAAAALQMVPAESTTFMVLSPEVIAEIQRSSGGVFDPSVDSVRSVFDEFTIVKSVGGG